MSNFKNMMSELRISKEKAVDKKVDSADKSNLLILKKGKKYNVRLLPYITETEMPKTLREVLYHYENGKKYLCENKFNGCKLCAKDSKMTTQRFVNVQLIKTDDEEVVESNYYILNLHWSLFTMINKHEMEFQESLFDVYGSSEITISPKLIDKGTYQYLDFSDSKIGTVKTAISPDIDSFEDEQIIAYLKDFTFDLDVEVEDPEKFEGFQNSNTPIKTIAKEEVKEKVISKPKLTPTPKKEVVVPKETPKEESEDDSSLNHVEDYVTDFLSTIND